MDAVERARQRAAMTRSRAVVHDRPNSQLEICEYELPEPTGRLVRVRLHSSGICHSQLTTMAASREAPALLGHEGYGTVEQVGSGARLVAPGDTVIVSWLPRDTPDDPEPLATARLDLADGRTATSPHVYTWAEHCTVDERYLCPLPPTYPREPAAALLGCAVLTGAGAIANAFDVGPEDTVAVLGAGGVGLCAVYEAAQRSATVIAVDLDSRKLHLAKALGATHCINASDDDPVAAIRRIASINDSPGATAVLDCVGTERTLDQALKSARSVRPGRHEGGRVGLVGLPPGPLTIDAEHLLRTGKTVTGISGGNSSQADILSFAHWISAPDRPLTTICTEASTLDDILPAVARLRSGRISGRALVLM